MLFANWWKKSFREQYKVKEPSKIFKLVTLKRKVENLRREGKKIAFTNGCFDIFHFGHISYLQKAKKGRVLIVGLNSDKSIRKIKGKNRPIIKQENRAGLLAALSCVDFVVLFDEDTPINLIKSLKPDVLIKGADWKDKGVAGRDIVSQYGGKVEFITYVPNLSTSQIIKDILSKCKS